MAKPMLHDYWRSSASYRVRIALNLKGIGYDWQQVNLLTREQRSEAHRERNPQGLVPVLDIDHRRLTQSLAIIEYLDETRPHPPLLPADPGGRARVRALAQVIAMEIHPICNISVANHVAGLTGGGDEAKAAWMQHFITRGLEAVEKLLDHPATGRFCHGDSPGLGECCLIPQLYNARRWQVDFSIWPRIDAISDACNTLGAIGAAHPDATGPPLDALGS